MGKACPLPSLPHPDITSQTLLVDGISVGPVEEYTFDNVTQNHTIRAVFEKDRYTIQADAGDNGTISPQGSVSVADGESLTVTVTPASGYHIADVTVDGASIGPVEEYTFDNVTQNHTIRAVFEKDRYTIQADTGDNGTISPQGSVSVADGESLSFTVTPANGYHIADVLVDGISVGPVEEYTFDNVTQNHTIRAVFEKDRYTIQADAGDNGTISPQGSVSVADGESLSFTVTPASGYHIADVTVDGASIGPVEEYTFDNVTQNHTIRAVFEKDRYTIQADAGDNGTISPQGSVSVADGESLSFTVTPASGYHIADVTVDGASIGPVAEYTFDNVTQNHAIRAVFEKDRYTIQADTGDNGTISPQGPVSVADGESRMFTVTPAAGYHVADVLVDGVSVGPVEEYTFSDIRADHHISATFEPVTYTLTVNTAGNGRGEVTPSPGTHTYQSGTAVQLSAKPSSGSVFDEWSGDAAGSEETASVVMDSDKVVTAGFLVKKREIILARSGANGTIEPSGTVYVNAGRDITFTMIPDEGYRVSDVKVDGKSAGAISSYTFEDVVGRHAIIVTFEKGEPTAFTITSSADENGRITPTGSFTASPGDSIDFTITPDPHHHIVDVLVDDVSLGPIGEYTLANVRSNHTVSAVFGIDRHTLTMSVEGNGMGRVIPREGEHTFAYGTVVNIRAVTAPKSTFTGWSGDAAGASETTITIDSDKHITATFTKESDTSQTEGDSETTATIEAIAVGGGSIDPSGDVSVNLGSDRTFTFAPNEGNRLDDVRIDGVTLGPIDAYTFRDVKGDHTIEAVFVPESVSIITDKDEVEVPEGGEAELLVSLSAEPEDEITVVIGRAEGDPDIIVKNGRILRFGPSNWSVFQSVVLSANLDEDADIGSAVIRLNAIGLPSKEVIAVEGELEGNAFPLNLIGEWMGTASLSGEDPGDETTVSLTIESRDGRLFYGEMTGAPSEEDHVTLSGAVTGYNVRLTSREGLFNGQYEKTALGETISGRYVDIESRQVYLLELVRQ